MEFRLCMVLAAAAVLSCSVRAFRVMHEHPLPRHPTLEEFAASAFPLDDIATLEDIDSWAAQDTDQVAEVAVGAAPAATAASEFNKATPRVEQISQWPRAYIYHNFLSDEEADHLIRLASPHMTKSKVIMGESGSVADSKVRTSSGAWIQRGQDHVVQIIEERIANWTGAPLENAEPMHVLHYGKDEEYQTHYDFYFDEISLRNGGQRVATIVMYLSTVEEGGETVFPASIEKPSPEQAQQYSVCGRQGISAKPVKGDALLFFSVLPDGINMDELSLHAGCPVIKGEKWAATKWLREEEWIDAPLHMVEAVKRERELMAQRKLGEQIYADALGHKEL